MTKLKLTTKCIFYFFVAFINFPFVLCPTVNAMESEDDTKLTVPQIIRKYGYPLEVHQVTTSDGYILTLHRIPHGRNETNPDKKSYSRVVYLQHALICSSADWIIPGPGKGLGYLLADKGFDIWMGNARGNKFSRRHQTISPISRKFWDFSWHEISKYDLPAMIDYVLRNTGQEKLVHIGFSQGTTTFYAMAALNAEYDKKMIAHISLSPVVYMDHASSPFFRTLGFWNKPLSALFELIGQWEFVPNTKFLAMLEDLWCKDDDKSQILCKIIIFAVLGHSSQEFNTTLLPMILAHYPAGASTKQVLHYAQLLHSGKFRLYDYGRFGNYRRYKSITPPDYKLENIETPVFMFYAENDWYANVTDVDRLCKKIKNCKKKFLVKEKTMSHSDFLFGKNIKESVYDKVVKLVEQSHKSFELSRSQRLNSIANINYCNLIWVFVSQTIHLLFIL